MRHQFESGMELGRLIERQRGTDVAVSQMRAEIKEVRKEVSDIKHIIQRAALLLTLWGSALGLAMTNDTAASIIVSLLQKATGKGS